MNYVSTNLSQFIDFMHEFIDINTRIVGDLLMITVSACIHQLAMFFVFARIQHVVALWTEFDAYKTRPVHDKQALDSLK